MKEYLLNLAKNSGSQLDGLNLAREYLQTRMLQSFQRSGAMTQLAFHGGTALRFLYNLPRFSEDLDFSLMIAPISYQFATHLNNLHRQFDLEGYELDIKINVNRIVNSAFVRFLGLPYELHLSPHKSANLSIRIEIDTNPPQGATLETSSIRRHVFLRLQHHDRATLLAGKLHALLYRKFTKGRDLYDLFWYLSITDWPFPNVRYLQNALLQTGWENSLPDEHTWPQMIRDKLESLEWSKVIDDVLPFLENRDEIKYLTKTHIFELLDRFAAKR